MAEKISVEIALDGGTEVERQLDSIGKAGQKAFGDIQSAAAQVNLDSTTSQFDELGNAGQAAFDKVQTAAQNAAAFEQIIQGVRKVEGAFEALGTAVTRMASRMTRSLGIIGVAARALGPLGIALGVAGGAFIKFGDDATDSINALTAAGAKLSLTPQQLDQLQKALRRTGVSADAIGPGLEALRKHLQNIGDDTNIIKAVGRFITELERMPDGVKRTQRAIEIFGDVLGPQIIAALRAGTLSIEQLRQAFQSVTPVTQEQIQQAAEYEAALNLLSAAWTELKQAVTTALAPMATSVFQFLTAEIKALQADIEALIPDLQAIWSALQAIDQFSFSTLQAAWQAITAAAEAFKEAAITSWNQIVSAVQGAGQAITTFVSSLVSIPWDVISGLGVAAWNAITGAINRAIDATRRFLGLQPQAGGAGQAAGAAPALAGGGMIGGRGTGTSDSNLAWVSRGEHIMPARAVAQPGVLSFLEALRRSGGNLRGVLDGMGRFALGGLVPRPALAFAGGGPVGSMSNVTINFPGLQPIIGLRASAAAVDELHRAAALAQVRSGGRKPSRYS